MKTKKSITKFTQIIQREDGSEVKIVAQACFGAGLAQSTDVYVHRRESSEQDWHLCSTKPHPDWFRMSVDNYINFGRSEMLQAASPGEILKAVNEIGKPLHEDQSEAAVTEARDMQTIFAFGSNLAGRHGKGAALFARQHHGAIYGQGIGRQGNSYAIPTKDAQLCTLPLEVIKNHADDFIEYARVNPHLQIKLTAIGCGLAGYTPAQIAPMFQSDALPHNIELPEEFLAVFQQNEALARPTSPKG